MKDRQKHPKGKTPALFALAKKKGLTVQKNIFSLGYTVILPNGEGYPAQSIDDLRAFVKDY